MTIRIDLFLCGEERRGSRGLVNQSGVEIQRRSAPLSRWSEADFSGVVVESKADWLVFADTAFDIAADDLERFRALCDSEQDAAAVVCPSGRNIDLSHCWERLPLPLAILLAPLESHAVVGIRREGAADFAKVDRPLWDMLIRCSAGAGGVSVVSAADISADEAGDASIALPALRPVRPDRSRVWLYEHVSRLDISKLLTSAGHREDMVALRAGLLQLHDYLDESHDLSQTVQGEGRHRAGDYWHAMMHRREPDYSNAKYWFRRVGRHPVFEPLADRAARILSLCTSPGATEWRNRLQARNGWEPFEFVDLCEACAAGHDEELTRAAELIQFAEMLLLIEQTFVDAEA